MTGSLENIFQLSKVARLGGGGGWVGRGGLQSPQILGN